MRCFLLAAALIACVAGLAVEDAETHLKKTRKHHSKHHNKDKHHHGKHHHHHHGHKHHKDKSQHEVVHAEAKHVKDTAVAGVHQSPTMVENIQALASAMAMNTTKEAGVISHVITKTEPKILSAKVATKPKAPDSEDTIVKKMRALEEKLEKKKVDKQGQILVSGPLPADFKQRFAQAVAHATGADAQKVKVTSTKDSGGGIVQVSFMASPHLVDSVEAQAADPESKLANGNLHSFLVAKGDDDDEPEEHEKHEEHEESQATPVQEKGIDIDTAMPYGDLEPFGREDTAQELTEDSISESNSMVDQLERAEVAEEKRAVFRSLTRLRGAAITSFDGVARSQTGNIDEYNKIHQWRTTHPLHHLADEESDISKWAFPDNADF